MDRPGRRAHSTFLALAFVLVGSLAFVWGASPASAHAELTSSNPADGARLQSAPAAVQLQFSESVTAPNGGVKVVDSTGKQVDTGKVTVSGATVAVPLTPGLGDGGYIVSYNIISADSHPIQGGISFVVGNGALPSSSSVAAARASSSQGWQVGGAVLRFITYFGGALLVGGILFLVLVRDGKDESPKSTGLLIAAALFTAAGAFGQLMVQAAQASSRGLFSLFTGSAGIAVAQRFGWSMGLVIAGAIYALVVVLLAGGDRRVLAILGLPVALFIPVGFAVAGHPTTGGGAGYSTMADLAHSLAACAWIGGLFLLIPAWRYFRTRDEPVAAGGMVRRFSAVATVSIIVVTAAGVVLAWREVTWSTLFNTTYGLLLVSKVAVVLALAAVGAYNHFTLVPKVGKAGDDHVRAWRHLGGTLKFEAAAFVVVLGLTAVLVDVSPPTARVSKVGAPNQTLKLGADSVQLEVVPPKAGQAKVSFALIQPNGLPLQLKAANVNITYELASKGIGPIQRPVTLAGPGRYRADGTAMSVPGLWTVTVIARTSTFNESRASAKVKLS